MLRTKDGSMDEVILEMWKDGMKCIHCKNKDRIYFEDFKCFFRVQTPKQQPGGMETLAEDPAAVVLSSPRSSKWKERKRVSITSERLLAPTLALGIDLDSSKSGDDEDDLSPFHKTDRSSRRSSFQVPRRGPSSKAILVKSRSIGILES